MASERIDLGQLGLASTASGLRLQLTSHAEIASPEEGLEIDLCGLTTIERPWCRKGHGFHLYISLVSDSDFAEVSMKTLGRAVSDQLGTAEQWQRLPLCPASIKHTAAGTERASVMVHLDHHTTKTTKRQLHKLENGVPDHDRAPPSGVKILQLNSIHLTMRFLRTASRKRRKLEPSLSEVSTHNAHLKSHPEKAGGQCRRSKTSPVPESASNDHADMLFEGSRSAPEMLEENMTMSSALRKRSYSTGDLKADDKADAIHEDLLEIFDAGLRLAITPHPGRLPKGVRIVSNESFKHLADCFPTLWSPGHLANVSSRAVFLPTVSHALTKVCSTHTRKPVLRSKLAELNRQAASSSCGLQSRGQATEGGSCLSAQESVAKRLWEMMQRTLFEKDSNCPMKPFTHSFEHELDDDADIWADWSTLDAYTAEDQDLGDFLSDDESMLGDELLTPEPGAGHVTNLLWNDVGASENHVPEHTPEHVAGDKRGLRMEVVQEEDEVLSLCGSVGSMVVDELMDVASYEGPERWLMPAECLMQEADVEMEMDELILIQRKSRRNTYAQAMKT